MSGFRRPAKPSLHASPVTDRLKYCALDEIPLVTVQIDEDGNGAVGFVPRRFRE